MLTGSKFRSTIPSWIFNYKNLISESAEFILEQTGIQVDNSYLLKD